MGCFKQSSPVWQPGPHLQDVRSVATLFSHVPEAPTNPTASAIVGVFGLKPGERRKRIVSCG